jgi:hypothetical protein
MPQMSWFWGSVQLACWQQDCPPELLPYNCILISLPKATSNFVLQNLLVRTTGLTTADHVQPRQPRTSTSGFFTCGMVWDEPPGQLIKLWVCTTKEFLHKLWLREAHLCVRRPHQGLDLTAVQRRNRLQRANTNLQWPLAHWRSVLFTDESQFHRYLAEGRHVWRCVGERFADANVVNRVPHGGGGVMVWAGISYRQRTQLHFIDGNLSAMMRSWGLLSCHSSAVISSCFSMIMHGPMSQWSVHNSW